VLPGSAGVAVPAIVREVDQHLRAETGKLANLVGEDRLIAEEDAVAMAIEAEDLALGSAAHLANVAGEGAGKGEQFMEGHILAEGNEVDFVVAAQGCAVRVDDQRGVVALHRVFCFGESNAFSTDDQRSLRRGGHIVHRCLKARISFKIRRGRLRPCDQVRVRRVRRADNLALRRAGLRDSHDVGFALLGGQTLEFGDVPLPFAGMQPAVVAGDVEVGLD